MVPRSFDDSAGTCSCLGMHARVTNFSAGFAGDDRMRERAWCLPGTPLLGLRPRGVDHETRGHLRESSVCIRVAYQMFSWCIRHRTHVFVFIVFILTAVFIPFLFTLVVPTAMILNKFRRL